mmetsp:Transcript_19973/g.33446  ORF Transcript_19973/g.33446 Transcript_19973/m.33446 type:complete len:300 (+) Transcript_19973:86-985(+)|eukprot:CAMPEP_0175006312 /NCGR_PEP_ID=MMETSP0005-20121125/5790_1 /TAXON_ID=420556 /ORGANISM="Ochromonas sp., Strain CCMP1393" /LENGTH=299 /DNA_ID=CAMNT_0016261637 /DNA_START=91 /DNA_END=990 /DNA_ORIENTATION=+
MSSVLPGLVQLIALIAEYQQLLLIWSICVPTAMGIIGIVLSYRGSKPSGKAAEKVSPKENIVAQDGAVRSSDPNGGMAANSTPPTRPISKSISFNTVFNLEEFMVRLYKLGFRVQRLKEKEVKQRLIGITRGGEVVLHKVPPNASTRNSATNVAIRAQRPYWKIGLKQLMDCFASANDKVPSFIMDFKGKTLHLGVATLLDRDYLVKGFRLLMHRMLANANFFARSTAILSGPLPAFEGPNAKRNGQSNYRGNVSSGGAATAALTSAALGSRGSPREANKYDDDNDDDVSIDTVTTINL